MRLIKAFPFIALCVTICMAGCQKSQETFDTDLAFASGNSAKESSTNPKFVIQSPINLGVAGKFAILSKTGITDVFPSVVTGDVGSSPITGAAIHLICNEVSGRIFSVNAAGPFPCRITNPGRLTTAVANMETAYTEAAARSNPRFLNLGAGNIGGLTLKPGLYKWTTALLIPTDITLSGGPNAIWVLQVAGTLKTSSGVKIILAGGAQAKNIYWQTSGAVTLGTTSHFEGIILSKTGINLLTGASINGRLLAQTAVTLQKSTVINP